MNDPTLRPRVKPEYGAMDRWLDAAGVGLLLLLWAVTIWLYFHLPETIPVHFNLHGEADRFGDKSSLFLQASIATGVFLLITLLMRVPHLFNYPVPVTEANAEKMYTNAVRMLRVVRIAEVLIFFPELAGMYGRVQDPNRNIRLLWIPETLLAVALVAYFVRGVWGKSARR
jgi:uncharacterized membrane protein